jgi:rhamnosyltransferase
MPHVSRALAMLQNQSFRNFELLAVDSGSTDGSLDELCKYCNRVKQIASNTYMPGKVINEAIAGTNHEIIVLLNADAVPLSSNWLAQLLQPIHENRADATFSQQRPRANAHFIVAYDYERAYDSAQVAPGFFSAVACAFKRQLWEQSHFPESGYAEDSVWAAACMAIGARIQLVEESIVEHSHNYTLQELFRKRYRQAVTQTEKVSFSEQLSQCLRELARDTLQAIRKGKPHTIPYNMAYRITIHYAQHKGSQAQ